MKIILMYSFQFILNQISVSLHPANLYMYTYIQHTHTHAHARARIHLHTLESITLNRKQDRKCTMRNTHEHVHIISIRR